MKKGFGCKQARARAKARYVALLYTYNLIVSRLEKRSSLNQVLVALHQPCGRQCSISD